MNNDLTGFDIINRTYLKFNLISRLRVLFSRKVIVEVTITVDKEVNVLKTVAKTMIEEFIDSTPKEGYGTQESNENIREKEKD